MNAPRCIKQPWSKRRVPVHPVVKNHSHRRPDDGYDADRERLRRIIRESPHKITESFLSYYHPSLCDTVKEFTKDEILHAEDFTERMELFLMGEHVTPRCHLDGCDNFCSFHDGRFLPVCDFHREHRSVSDGEQRLRDILRGMNVDFLTNDTELIGTELDIVIPSYRLAIEYNGLFWHSEKGRRDFRTNYRKWKLCKDKGYELLTVWDDHFGAKCDLLTLHLARKFAELTVMKPDSFRILRRREAVDFLTEHHKSLRDRHTVSMGAFHGGELIACLTTRNDDDGGKEIIDYTEKGFLTLSSDDRKRLLAFRMNHPKTSQTYVYMYTDCDEGNGSLALSFGFRKPQHRHCLVWVRNGKRISERIMFRKLSEVKGGEYRQHNAYRVYGTGFLYWESGHK